MQLLLVWFGAGLLTSSGSIGLHYLECYVHVLWTIDAYHVLSTIDAYYVLSTIDAFHVLSMIDEFQVLSTIDAFHVLPTIDAFHVLSMIDAYLVCEKHQKSCLTIKRNWPFIFAYDEYF